MTKIQPTFLRLPVNEWPENTSFKELKSIVSAFHVVNDAAERAVKFGSDFNQIRTKSETHRQKVLQSVEFARRAFPQATKKCMTRVSANRTVPGLLAEIDFDARSDK